MMPARQPTVAPFLRGFGILTREQPRRWRGRSGIEKRPQQWGLVAIAGPVLMDEVVAPPWFQVKSNR